MDDRRFVTAVCVLRAGFTKVTCYRCLPRRDADNVSTVRSVRCESPDVEQTPSEKRKDLESWQRFGQRE